MSSALRPPSCSFCGLDALGATFTTADFKAEYQKQRYTLPDNRSITRYLNSLVEDKLIERVKKGAFKKL